MYIPAREVGASRSLAVGRDKETKESCGL
jgi:hypothetical protein